MTTFIKMTKNVATYRFKTNLINKVFDYTENSIYNLKKYIQI